MQQRACSPAKNHTPIFAIRSRHAADAQRSGKQRAKSTNMMATAVDAPGDAPKRAVIDRSALATISVPNLSSPPPLPSALMILTLKPATLRSQSADAAVREDLRKS